jgi:hypothetical protein
LSYGLFATPDVVADNIRSLFGVLPRDDANLTADQLTYVVGTSEAKKARYSSWRLPGPSMVGLKVPRPSLEH